MALFTVPVAFLAVPLTLFVCALIVAAYLKLRQQRASYSAGLDDEHIRRIVDDGFLVYEEDEPLDLQEIEQAEREFWTEEHWDEADEW